MIKKLLPVVLILIGLGAGVGAGLFLKPAPEPPADLAEGDPCGEDPNAAQSAKSVPPEPLRPARPDNVAFSYVELEDPFLVPVLRGDDVSSMAIVSISLEVVEGATDGVYSLEPKIRDSFLQAFFDHAANGGFDGAFANNQNLMRLRRSLMERGVDILGDRLNDVLITDIGRQDM